MRCHCCTFGGINAHIVFGGYHCIKHAGFERIYSSRFTKVPGNRKHIRETIKTNKSNQSRSAILQVAQETENTKEKIDEIEVETNCPHDVFVGGEAAVDEIRVVDDVSAEQKCTHNGDYEIYCRTEWDEDSDEAGHHCVG
jgi:hypothetical protein